MSRMFTLTPKRASEKIVKCMQKGLVPLLTSSPGIGKSSLVAQIAKDYSLKLIDLRLSQCTPEDLQGFPMRTGNKATFTPFDIFPLAGEDSLPEGCEGWLLFLDELTSATKPVQVAAYKLILDRMVGSFKLHPNVTIVAAGNKATDKAVVNQMSTALQSRMIHFELEPSLAEWTEIAYAKNWDTRVISYLNYVPSKLMDFRPDHQDCTFPCPRTWEFVSRMVEDEKTIDESLGPDIGGTIGDGAAVEFITFAKEFDKLPKISEILADPDNAPVPPEASTKWAMMGVLVDQHDDGNIGDFLKYIDRFPTELQILFFRGAVAKNPAIEKNTNFTKRLVKMARYLS